MSPRDWQNRIRDILDAIAEIQKFTRGMDYETFKDDHKSIRAVEMNFIIIGEAANQIPEDVEEKYSQIPWSLMRAMRNRIVHVYFKVDVGYGPKRSATLDSRVAKITLKPAHTGLAFHLRSYQIYRHFLTRHGLNPA